jgi:hypothetical protein
MRHQARGKHTFIALFQDTFTTNSGQILGAQWCSEREFSEDQCSRAVLANWTFCGDDNVSALLNVWLRGTWSIARATEEPNVSYLITLKQYICLVASELGEVA